MHFRINLIKPQILNDPVISSWFTLRNHQSVHPEKNIAGLNLGLNTEEAEAIILKNRDFLLNEIGVEASQIAYALQVHKTDVKKVTKGGTYPNTDGFVTREKGLALAIQVADCAAVLFGDSNNNVIGAAHAGWRGATGGIVPKTIKKMKTLGAQVNYIKVYVSPCISLENFEVGEEVAAMFPDEFIDTSGYQKPHVDLKAFIQHQLIQEGVQKGHIVIADACTIADENYYSYRRQQEKSGRMMGIIKMNKY